MPGEIRTKLGQFRSVYTDAFERDYPQLIRNLEHWELSEEDCEALEVFAAQSENNRICLGLYLAKYSPRESFSRKRGYHILDKAIEESYLNDDPEREVLIQGILSFIRTNPPAFARMYHVAKSWETVRAALAKKAG
ncbi:MAG: hypothetical protein H6858_03760 [Rhodospirillales bacterium]|nr:hypothetical protein [Alphaproteobacteria bacterium]MCB9976701.1 hypothetical protein [Rhodospirillales bacterium]